MVLVTQCIEVISTLICFVVNKEFTLKKSTTFFLALFFSVSVSSFAEELQEEIDDLGQLESSNQDEMQGVSSDIEALKNEILELNTDLFILEEDLLFSANTQLSVFISVDVGGLFELDSVQLKVDDKIVSNYLYTKRESAALVKGGVQRLYIGNITSGEHEVTAFFIGKGPNGRNYKRAVSKKIEKADDAKFVELKISGDVSKEQPSFSVKVWE